MIYGRQGARQSPGESCARATAYVQFDVGTPSNFRMQPTAARFARAVIAADPAVRRSTHTGNARCLGGGTQSTQ